MRLGDYLSSRLISPGDFASAVGVDRSTVTRWLTTDPEKRVKPHWDQMAKIAAATGGAVLPNDFMEDLPALIAGSDAADNHDPGAGPVRRAG